MAPAPDGCPSCQQKAAVALQPLYEARSLSLGDAEALVAGDDNDVKQRAEWYFDTGISGLDLRNSLVFLSSLLAKRDGGRIQSKIPAALTTRWALRRISVPDVLAFVDIATLACVGALQVPPKESWGLAAITSSPRDNAIALGVNDPVGRAAFQANLTRWVLDEPAVLQRSALRAGGLREGTFDNGFLFHVPRLPRALPELESFAAAYAGARDQRLVDLCSARWPRGVGLRVRSLVNDGVVTGIQARSIGNILAMLQVLDVSLEDEIAVGTALPPIARYALGGDDPLDHNRSRRPDGAERVVERTGTRPPRRFALPMLDALRDSTADSDIARLVTNNAARIAAQILAWRNGEPAGDALGALITLLGPSITPEQAVEGATNALLVHLSAGE